MQERSVIYSVFGGKGNIFSEDLPDIQLNQLLDIFNKLEKPFKEYIIQQVQQLAETLDKSKAGQKKHRRRNDT